MSVASSSPSIYRETKTKLGSFLELTQQARNRAKSHRDALSASDRSRTNSRTRRRNSIRKAVGEVLSGRFDVKGVSSDASTSLDLSIRSVEPDSPTSTPGQRRRRFHRRGSATKLTMEEDSNHTRDFMRTDSHSGKSETSPGTPVKVGRRRLARRRTTKAEHLMEQENTPRGRSPAETHNTSQKESPSQRQGTGPAKNLNATSLSSSTQFEYPTPMDFRSPPCSQSKSSSGAVRKPERQLSAPPMLFSSSSHSRSVDVGSQPKTIDERPLPRRNSISHHSRHDNDSVTTIDQIPLPMRSSSHHRRTSNHTPTTSQHQRECDTSVQSGASFFQDEGEEGITIDQRPLPLKEISVDSQRMRNTLPPRAALPPLTTPSQRQRSLRTGFPSAQTARRPSALPPRSPGVFQTPSNRRQHTVKIGSFSPSPLALSPQDVGSDTSSPLPAPPFSDDSFRGGGDDDIVSPMPSPKPILSPFSHIDESPTGTRVTPSRSPKRRWGSRRKSSGALPTQLPFDSNKAAEGSNHGSRHSRESNSQHSRRSCTSNSPSSNGTPSSSKSEKRTKKRLGLSLLRKAPKTSQLSTAPDSSGWRNALAGTSDSDSPGNKSNGSQQEWNTASPARHSRKLSINWPSTR